MLDNKKMQKEVLDLKHQSLISPLIRELSLSISEYSFANLFLFRNEHKYEILTLNDIYIKGVTYTSEPFIMPLKHSKEWILDEITFLLKTYKMLFPLPEEWNSFVDHPLSLTKDQDYLFLTEKMKTYPGRHLDKKRNLVKQFKENYVYSLCPFDKDKALRLLEAWKEERGEEDYFPCKEAILYLGELRLDGWAIEVDGNMVGFIIGEALNEEVYVWHFSKADIAYRGIYPLLYQEVAKELSHFKYINMEQDLGIPGLRQAKHSYQPDRYLLKMRVVHSPSDISSSK